MVNKEPNINFKDEALASAGFTTMGIKRFKDTMQDYCTSLFKKAISYAEVENDQDLSLEITHEHVRFSAASMINRTLPQSKKWIIAQVSEYVLTATAGVGAGHLDKGWGIGVFVISLAVAVVLFVLRTNNK